MQGVCACQSHKRDRPGGQQQAAGAYLRSWSLETLLKKHVLGCWACEVLDGVQLYSPGPGLYCSSKTAPVWKKIGEGTTWVHC